MRIKIPQISFYGIKWSVFLFILIFSPPFMPYPHLVLAVISFLIMTINYRNDYKRIMLQSTIYSCIFEVMIIVSYILAVPLMVSAIMGDIVNARHYISLFNRYGVLIVTAIPCVTLFLCSVDRYQLDYHAVIEIIINAGLIEGMCAVIAFLFPSIKYPSYLFPLL